VIRISIRGEAEQQSHTQGVNNRFSRLISTSGERRSGSVKESSFLERVKKERNKGLLS